MLLMLALQMWIVIYKRHYASSSTNNARAKGMCHTTFALQMHELPIKKG